MSDDWSDEEFHLTFQVLKPDDAAAFHRLIQVIAPHEQPELARALRVTSLSLDAKLVGDLGLRVLLLGGLADLQAASLAAHKRPMAALSDEELVPLVQAQEDSMFFQTLIQLAKSDFYNRHIVWQVLGYPDLANDSGYIDNGFDRLEV
jgi:hypothetical protein